MRGRIYLLSLLLAVGGAAYFAAQDNTVAAVLAVVPGYFVIAYVLVLVSTFLPGAERERFEAARAAAFAGGGSPPADTEMHPAYMGSMLETTYSGDGFLGWPDSGHLVFRATQPRTTFQYPAEAFRGFRVESEAPSFLSGGSLIEPGRGPLVMLDGGPAAMMARVWVQPRDAASFVGRLRSAGVPELG